MSLSTVGLVGEVQIGFITRKGEQGERRVVIEESEGPSNSRWFTAKLADEDGQDKQMTLGYTYLCHLSRAPDGTYEGGNHYDLQPNHPLRTQDEEGNEDKAKMCVEVLNSSQKLYKIHHAEYDPEYKYYGVGTALLQTVIEYSYEQGCEGRVILQTGRFGPHGFYYKLGMQAKDEAVNRKIQEELTLAENEDRAPDTKSLGLVVMHLPSESLAKWKEHITEHPILYRTPEVFANLTKIQAVFAQQTEAAA